MEIYFLCSLSGEDFDPTPFLNDDQLEISEYYRVGDIGKRGRWKGRPLESGYINFKSKDDFDQFVKKLYSMKDLIVENKAERRVVHISIWYEDQCNWEFAPSILAMISELNLTLTLTCAKLDNERLGDDK